MEEDKKQKTYEISFLLKTEAELSVIDGHLKTANAEIVERGPLASIKLAYPIEKNLSAYFGFIHFKAAGAAAQKLNQDMRFDTHIIRYLIITPPPAKPEKRAPMSSRAKPVKKEAKAELTNEALEEKLAALKSESGI